MNTAQSKPSSAYIAKEDGFYPLLGEMAQRFRSVGTPSLADVRGVLRKPRLTWSDFAVLLSPQAAGELESMAARAHEETLRHFGLARQFFAPLYLANYCTNRCVYCGFHAGTGIARKALSEEEVLAEGEALAATGLRRVLVLTGDAPKRTGADYIARNVRILARYFPSIGIEVQALTEQEYSLVARSGADSMTMFQETYDPVLYERLHPAGPKRDFCFRLDAPHRAVLAGMRGITLGALLGLGDWRFDLFMAAMHGDWLQRRYPEMELSFSLPRIRPRSADESREEVGTVAGQSIFEPNVVPDREFVQALTALRCFLPHVGITLSTREPAFMRDRLLGLGVTRVSAGVSTAVGGYVQQEAESPDSADPVQFVIDDGRSVEAMAADMEKLGFQPVFADWVLPAGGEMPLSAGLNRALGVSGEQHPGHV